MCDDRRERRRDEDDTRLEFISSYVMKALLLKQEKWHKMITTEELKFIILDWLNNPQRRLLIFTLNTLGTLIPILSYARETPGKSIYFIKKNSIAVTMDNFRNEILFGDISPNPVENLSVLVDEIFAPLLRNPLNRKSWPELVSKDVDVQIQGMRSILAEVKGNIFNKTVLPITAEPQYILKIATKVEQGELYACEENFQNELEGMVITWTQQISEVLKETLIVTENILPAQEVAFWNNKHLNLDNIYKQLQDTTIKAVATILEKLDSVYFSAFSSTFKEVVLALHESKDITLWLTPLIKYTTPFSEISFVHSKTLIKPLIHILFLIWANSRYYCITKRMEILLNTVCNLLIARATDDLQLSKIFNGDAEEGLTKISKTILILEYFKQQVEEYCEKFPTMIQQNFQPDISSFSPRKIFTRLNNFEERLHELKDIFSTAACFQSLEKLEIGGVRGKTLSQKILCLYDEFMHIFEKWGTIEIEILDSNNQPSEFKRQKNIFLKECEVLDSKLGTLLLKAFEDCSNLEQNIKLIQMCEKLLSRPRIESNSKQITEKVYKLYMDELRFARENISKALNLINNNDELSGINIDKNFPTVPGLLMWARKIQQRITNTAEMGLLLNSSLFNFECDEVISRERTIISTSLKEFEDKVWVKWTENLDKEIFDALHQYVLVREPTALLRVNMSDKILCVFREVKCLQAMQITNIPEKAIALDSTRDEILEKQLKLSRIVDYYNVLQLETIPAEKKLISDEIVELDDLLLDACSRVSWAFYDAGLINEILRTTEDIYHRVTQAQKNLESIMESIKNWSHSPFYEQSELNKCLQDSNYHSKHYKSQIEKCVQSKLITNKLLMDNFILFFKKSSTHFLFSEKYYTDGYFEFCEKCEINFQGEDIDEQYQKSVNYQINLFQEYQKYVDQLVSEEILQAVILSLSCLKSEMELENNQSISLFEVKVILDNGKITFVPSFDTKDPNGFLEFMKQLISETVSLATIIPKIYRNGNQISYIQFVSTNEEIVNLTRDIICFSQTAMKEAINYTTFYHQFSYLWQDNKNKHLRKFLQGCEEANVQSKIISQRIQKLPSLEKFKVQIDHYNDLYEEIQKFESHRTFKGWLVVDMKGLQQEILNHVCKWANLYKQFLVRSVIDNLKELESFIRVATTTLDVDVGWEDLEALLKVMSITLEIQERETHADITFKPLKEIITLLKGYCVEFDDRIFRQMEELPLKWLSLKTFAIKRTNMLETIREYQRNIIEKKVLLFECLLQSYKTNFKKMPFFRVPCEGIYNMCDLVHNELGNLKCRFNELSNSAELLQLSLPIDDFLCECLNDIRQVKQLWDFLQIVDSCMEDWKGMPWKLIDVENMEIECKRFSRDLRSLNKNVRSWEPYIYIEGKLKELVSSIRTITELQNPAVTERHWVELMHVTKLSKLTPLSCLVQLKNDHTATLSEMLSLNLHHHEEDVKNTVDKAVKEMVMAKILVEIQEAWLKIEFQYELHERRQVMLLKASEELIETLEDHQVQLQNIANSKFIDFLLKEVTEWQEILSIVDQVVTLWFEVQRKWIYLENIFIGSADIRAQLPCDSIRFQKIDEEFNEHLETLSKLLIVVDMIKEPYLCKRLEDLLKDLLLCEKALNNYLETKRMAYPRFYFISSADLLDILSNGNQPLLVGRHLIKLFDSIMQLKYKPNTRTAIGMISKEHDELIEFYNELECFGKVEIWLSNLIDTMRGTLHKLFQVSLQAYESKSREQWIFDWPAQPALCCSQISWTSEVNQSFLSQEDGYENAMKDYQRKQISQLHSLINLLLGNLLPGDRQKIMTICTIDVHCRDVVAKIIQMKLENSTAFQWQSQLRHRWDHNLNDCFANICDAEFSYAYEYLGNTNRLVITPLTDRCYITLTQSLHLVMGGAPAGPAGTGKTETTKDLGRALGVMVYVFNCSEQMDYKSCGNIYKGLAQTGAWGCFDEFNRISVEVLSVVAVQVKAIQDAIKEKKSKFTFMGETISIAPTVGIFVTMNPGYAGRTELPENLKALFRPCAMVVPDFALICEIMLVAEGFQEARILARKFITLYKLCLELLSKQDHYDWGLRAIKSVLVVAGSLKRGDRSRSEDQVLMRALRDFNIPKIVTEDIPIFMGLIGDLFPALDVPRQRFPDFEKLVRKSASDLKLQPQDGFILKVVQLHELFDVRHSVFIVGNAGTGKTKIWQTLLMTYKNQKLKVHSSVLNPKAVTNDELFGYVNTTTRDWRDGLFSSIMRDLANLTDIGPKWIILDGDIDPMWIESLNTLMDDNRILTLASNERITLKRDMRLLFEVGHLRAATPATVSRAGILYINPQDLGWYPYVASWLETRGDLSERTLLTILFEKYVPTLLENNKKFKKITPITDIALIQMTCNLLECLLKSSIISSEIPKDVYEMYFIFAAVWGFGSGLYQDNLIDWRREFHKWWISEFRDVRFPSKGLIFDYFLDPVTRTFLPWSTKVQNIEIDLDTPLQSILIPTTETTRLSFFLSLLMSNQHAVMLVGNSGCGKNSVFRSQFQSMLNNTIIQSTHFNFYTTSEMFQSVLEKSLEKKSGRSFGPHGNKRLIYFITDLNMPEMDSCGTVQPHTIVRQFMDYLSWYDRAKLILKDIRNCQFAASMNPTCGSFTIDPRLQRHFCTLAVNYPTEDTLNQIYETILTQHLENPVNDFGKDIKSIGKALVTAGVLLQRRIEFSFLPTALKFHYIFNMRDMANIFQGLMLANGRTYSKPMDLIRLYVHEATRVYHDKLMDHNDIKAFQNIIKDVFKKGIEDMDEDYVFTQPIIYSHFSQSLFDQKYSPINKWSTLNNLLLEAQKNYNELVGFMNLVMFEDAMLHVCRINRIIEAPRGNALLIGVGGSGKQTLARLAAFISSLSVFQINLKRGYSIQDMKADLAGLYFKVGIKNIACMFLMSDAQIPEESFLVLINDLLSSAEIPDLFSEDQLDSIINGIRNEVKQAGILDTKENCWKYFIGKVQRLLKTVLCFSPVGPTLRVRARKFPALISRTSIDWFHEWPKSALESVSQQFLSEIDILPTNLIKPIGCYMAYVHGTVNDISKIYFQNEKRYNYTTPKTFLEFIFLFKKLLTEKTSEHTIRTERLEAGMSKLAECSQQVDTLREQLTEQEITLKAKNEAADKLILMVSAENEKVRKEKFAASEEEKRVRIIEEDVSIKTKLCEEDLRKAEPALVAAQAALNTLNKNNLTELKSFGSPPKAVVNVCAAVMVLLAPNGKIPRDRSWRAAKLMMGKVDQFLNDLVHYDKDNIHPQIIESLQDYLKDPEFNPDKIVQKSVAAAGLCAWVINLHKYHEVFQIVGPKQQALQDSQLELKEARERLEFLKKKITDLEDKLFHIQSEFEDALAEKQKCQKEADKTAFTIDLAHRLVNGLGNENIRWQESILSLREKICTLPGDILLISCFLSYVGCFTRRYREQLQEKMWMPTFKKIQPVIPHTEEMDPMELIADDAQIAIWNNEGLPMDKMSTENATILTYSSRWPLLIDPQLQGLKWIKNKFGKDLVTVNQQGILLTNDNKGYLDVIEKSMANGNPLLIENVEESLDAVLDPLLSRAFTKKGRCIRIGDRDLDFNINFRLILHTKLANPHYKPEMQAQTTIINFTVTRDGLEDQLLAEVVKAERPDLEQLKTEVTIQQNTFKITLKSLEDELLERLNSAGKNVLEEQALVLNLEETKRTVNEIECKVQEVTTATKQIDETRENYRSAAKRASILYFVLNYLHRINPIYQFSLKAFMVVFKRAITLASENSAPMQRVANLVESITYQTFLYTSRGLFERDKLIFTSQMVIQILVHGGDVTREEIDFLLRFPYDPNAVSPADFITNIGWGGIRSLSMIEQFYNLDKDIVGSPKRWSKFIESDCPEREKFPGEWKTRSPLQRLCILRALRPDRMTYAFKLFIEQIMGNSYVNVRATPFTISFDESNSSIPIFFVLSPGVNPLIDVEKLGKKLKFSSDLKNFYNISLGQGQEMIAETAIRNASKIGHWIILQNVHLVAKWLPSLEKLLENISDCAHSDFRLFISAEPAHHFECHVIPQGILESSIKIINEPPTGMAANLHKALDNFSQETLEMCTQEAEFKTILFSLCYFHAVVAGTTGWNRVYPFNVGDLVISASVLYNYLEGNNRIPWEDLRYLFGEIMYGGHITDDWDRRLCRTYLEELMQQELVDGDFYLCPGFPAPPNLDYKGYHNYIDEVLPEESPLLYGLHPNAEIGFLTSASDNLLKTIFELQPRESELSKSCGPSREELVKIIIDDLLDKMQEEFNLTELLSRVEIRTPFVIVAMQECERMNILMQEMRRSLRELLLGLKGELTITTEMEKLDDAIFFDHVPRNWQNLAYPSLLGLQSWFADLIQRSKELLSWSSDFCLPSSVWLGGLFNPQSFLTAIMQESARKNEWPLDKMGLYCEVTRKTKDDVSFPPREGTFVNGLFLEGASWDCNLNSIVSLKPKELISLMPLIYIKAVVHEKRDHHMVYECPLYKTRERGSTYVWALNLKTKEKPAKWILGGVALLLQA